MSNGSDKIKELSILIRDRYSPIPKDENEKVNEAIQKLITHAIDLQVNTRALLEETARTIFRLFNLQEVLIGLKNPVDGLLRYEIFIGYRNEVITSLKKEAYTYDEFTNSERFPRVQLSNYSNFFIAEAQPVEEWQDQYERTFNRPILLHRERKSLDEFHEGDYIEIMMYGRGKELIGWIEISNTANKKLPPRSTIKWIESIASIVAIAIQRR